MEHSSIIIDQEGSPKVRHTSGLTIYDEALRGGRWVGRYWAAAGFVEPERLLGWVEGASFLPTETAGLDLAAFDLEVDGQSLHFGWEWVKGREEGAEVTGNRHSVVELQSTLRPITVRLHTEVDGTGFLTRWLDIVNEGERAVALGDAWPWSGLLSLASAVGGRYPRVQRRACGRVDALA